MKSVLCCLLVLAASAAAEPWKDTGYRGIWYYNQPVDTEYKYKYSGGMATYCANHIPHAIYAPAADKTFFVYGGTDPKRKTLWETVSYYDHKTGTLGVPTVLMDKKTSDAHDNPVLSIDGDGHLLVFASSHGTGRPSYIFKSKKPYDIEAWDEVKKTNFSYPQPWYIEGKGFLFLETLYKQGRRFLFSQTSADGIHWPSPEMYAGIQEGHYQVSRAHGSRVGTFFNYHPTAFQGDAKKKGLNWRTNLYYMETSDMGKTWQNVKGEALATPLTEVNNPARVRDYERDGTLMYTCDVNYDAEGRPLLLYVTGRTWEPGPAGGPHEWTVAHWTGSAWEFSVVATSDNNYDFGSLYVEKDGTWRVIGPTGEGPQRYNPGGEIVMWTSRDEGKTWQLAREVTRGSEYNHGFVRRPINAQPDFYAYWSDGNGRAPSECRLYFSNQEGDKVWRMPYEIKATPIKPERVK